ncbi:GapA-binding peptide SR1P [Metabacillus halosaccharovorans]|nr:GapA-binding peptide SR1P [Metabacillus halosaccharovorans]MCM3444205.1 GapA-binding peptide SR1P [Metabacillus halosaccharovorans]PMC34382.1 GapA-binding peptide SR1P [Bacillus sp. UMB0899]
MGTVICQNCNSTIDHFENEKVTVLYSKCECCDSAKKIDRTKK